MDRRITDSPAEGESKKALLEARDIALQDEAERRAADAEQTPPPPRKGRRLTVLLVLSLLFGAYAIIGKPAWLVTPPPEPEPPALQEASLRIAMWQLALHIERYREQHDGYPATIEQAGAPVVDGLTYQRVGQDGYLITGHHGSIDLALRHDDSLEEFVGNSLEIVAARGAQ